MTQYLAAYLGALLTAGGSLAFAYRMGRANTAWHDVRSAKLAVRATRRIAWAHTVRLTAGAMVLLAGLFAAAFDLAR
ncbi:MULTISPECIES: hypothetical protein [Actinoplanes]|uniref:hypothetical protein n=1 Tax=Actinoplanes TaxID=1865 RepID=UPI0005F2D535|nr:MULTISPECIES: hypothetical protein [Actinoplanes]GLY04626.1 hypothetical protein Acsp01_50050 [Actinoplanes sp. NBRC 101535]